MLTDTGASSPDEQQNNDFNNNNNKDNTITVNTNNTSLLSCGNSDATSNNSSMNNSPNNNMQHSPNDFSGMRPLMNPFARLSNDLLLQTTIPNSSFANYNSTFPIVTSAISNNNINNNNNINPVQFQMMPHLTNSFA